MNQYVLARKDFLHSDVYECESNGDVWYCETIYLEKATRCSLDDAMKQAKIHKQFGRHYIVKRVEE